MAPPPPLRCWSARILTLRTRALVVRSRRPGSGVDIVAGRLLFAGSINPDTEIVRQRLSLPETTKGMLAGTTDAMFFAGGLPTPGIADLLNSAPGQFSILPLDELLRP